MTENKRVISQSEVATFLNCPRKYQYVYADKLELQRVYFPFIAGKCWHESITLLYKHKSLNTSIDCALSTLHKSREEVQSISFIQEKDEIDFNRYEVILPSSIKKYYETYAKEINKFEVLHADEKFETRVYDSIYITGHPDMVLKHYNNNKTYLYELKTTSNITKELIDRYFYDFQTSFYFLLLENAYNISGVYFDAIKKPSIRIGKHETEKKFLSRLEAFYTDSLATDLFYQDSYKKNQSQLIEMLTVIKHFIYNIDNLIETKCENYPMNRLRCYDFSSSCEYLPLCNYGKNEITLQKYKIKKETR